MAAEKYDDESLVGTADIDDLGSSMVEAQKSALTSLSKQEKLLMLELQKTRLSIVEELEQLDPQISADNWMDIQHTISEYQTKIISTAGAETIDGQRRGGKMQMPASLSRQVAQAQSTTGMGSHGVMTSPIRVEKPQYLSATSPGRSKVVANAAYIPTSRMRTRVDMLPILATGISEVEKSIRRQVDVAMPTFKLPQIDESRLAEVLEESQTISKQLKEEKVHLTKTAVSTRKRLRFETVYDYTAEVLQNLVDMHQMDTGFIMNYFCINYEEWESVKDELLKRIQMRITVDTENVPMDDALTAFNYSTIVERERQEMIALTGSAESVSGGESLDGSLVLGGALDQPSMVSINTTKRSSGSRSKTMKSKTLSSSQQRSMGMMGSLSKGGMLDNWSVVSDAPSRASTAATSASKRGKKTMSKAMASYQRSQSNSDLLRGELMDSLKNMQHHTLGVKASIAGVQSMARVGNSKAKHMLFSIAAERLQAALQLLITKDLRRGWTAWKMVNVKLRRMQVTVQLVNITGLRMISRALNDAVIRVLSVKMNKWIYVWKRERARMKREKQTEASILIQRHMRAYLARKRVRILKEKIKFRRLYAAVIKIQAQFRGRPTHWKYKKFVRARLEDRSALRIQRVFRGHRSRKRVKLLRIAKNKNLAATKIQSVVRGRQGRNLYDELNQVRVRLRSAVKIQATIRGFVCRRQLKKILDAKEQYAASIVIQTRWRGAITRMSMGRRKKELLEYKEMRYNNAMNIQRVFRGYRSRLATRIRQIERERKNRKKNDAATKINTMLRGFLAKCKLERMKREHLINMLTDARSWKEGWSDDAESWFYLNTSTGEDLWEPPAVGYTKHDGTLVLADGQVIEDPDVLEQKEMEKKKNSETLCCECDERTCIHFCRECGDKYCTPCYKSSHATGTRRKHHPEPLGPIACSECELVLAIRWCVSCDEAYCDDCWRKVHSRGKRRFHPYSEVSSKGRIDTRVFTMDGSEIDSYDATYAQQQYEGEQQEQAYQDASQEYAQYAEAQGAQVQEWETYYDDDGYEYYYNQSTGVSQYESPY